MAKLLVDDFWLEVNTDRVELHLMPGYSPELNPDELLNADLKRNVNASHAHNVDLTRPRDPPLPTTPPTPAAHRLRLPSRPLRHHVGKRTPSTHNWATESHITGPS
ncbi:transposase [Saccharothrix sp. NRRL B-16348]|uniref:transposase n=1 Tax=Saccharothrix sp. NRRL B-16348 TaxID=1415542 RepID=UPI000AECA0B7|nr:transposase [Saccharothrix sp. NRRL B-16348]